MEKVKFRAWGGARYLELIDGYSIALDGRVFDDKGYEASWIILEQFTGLYDKDGKEIYIGDIVKFDDYDEGIIEAVRFLDLDIWPISAYGHNSLRYELLGNIHENPELLKGNNESI